MDLKSIASLALESLQAGMDADPSMPGIGLGGKEAAAAKLQNDLAAHDKRFHPHGYEGGECKYRERIGKTAEALGLGNIEGVAKPRTEEVQAQKESENFQHYKQMRDYIDEKWKAKLTEKGLRPDIQSNTKDLTDEEKSMLEAWHKEIDTERNAYIKKELGEAEADSIEKLSEMAGAEGEMGDKAAEKAEEIAGAYPEGDARHEGAQAILEKRRAFLAAQAAQAGEAGASGVKGDTEEAPGKEYDVNGNTYVDVSNMDFWDGLKAAWQAGFQGKGIVTDYDKMSGRWNDIKSTDPKYDTTLESLKSGLKDTLANELGTQAFGSAIDTEGLDDTQRAYVMSLYDAWKEAKPASKPAYLMKLNDFMQSVNPTTKGGEDINYGTGGLPDMVTPRPKTVPTADILSDPPKVVTDVSKQRELANEIESMFNEMDVDIIEDETSFVDGPRAFDLEYVYEDEDPAKLKKKFDSIAKRLGIKNYKFEDSVEGKRNTVRINITKPGNGRPASLKPLLEKGATSRAAKGMTIPVIAGETQNGEPMYMDLVDHGFLGGTTGSGKTTALNSILGSLFMTKSPTNVRVMINDAGKKGQDLGKWNGDKHLVGNVATSSEEVISNLQKACDEIQRRTALLGTQTLAEYNAKARAEGKPELPALLVVTDEMTDLFQSPVGEQAKEMIKMIVRKGRSFGIAHLGATQRPSADNTPKDTLGNNRICLKMKTPQESNMVIQGYRDGHKLGMRGDGMVEGSNGKTGRIQAPYTSDEDIEKIKNFNWDDDGIEPTEEAPKATETQRVAPQPRGEVIVSKPSIRRPADAE